MANHDRVRVTARPDRFGLCSVRAHADKGKENEYYCHCCNKTYCSSCLIDGISDENKGPDHKLVNIQKAYNDAKEEASVGAQNLHNKKEMIENSMNKVKHKMQRIKDNAKQI